MADLSLGLALVGAVLLAGVLLSAFLKSTHRRRLRKVPNPEGAGGLGEMVKPDAAHAAKASDAAQTQHSDAAAVAGNASGATAPGMAAKTDASERAQTATQALPEHVLRSADISAQVTMEGDTPVLQVPQTRSDDFLPMLEKPRQEKHHSIDAFIDAIATIPLKKVLSGDVLLPFLPSVFRCGTKPFLVEGLNQRSEAWEFMQNKQHYKQLRCAVQRANRHGAMNEIEFSEFVQKSQALAEQVNSEADIPDMLEEVAKARSLDKIAAESDCVLTFYLRNLGSAAGKAPWTLGLVQQHAVAIGFVQSTVVNTLVMPGRFSAQTAILTLDYCKNAGSYDASQRNELELPYFALSLDVPQVQQQEGAFTVLCHVAQQLANALQGEVVDDEGHVIGTMAMEVIEQQLNQIYTTLAMHSVAAGSQVARRLFN